MSLIYSIHWKKKKLKRTSITDDLIEYAIINSRILKDKRWKNLNNAICKIPASGRLLKVVYKRIGKDIKIITAYWIN